MSLSNGDLRGMILPRVSIDEFEPKAGENIDTIVVAFYLKDKDPADDLNTFIQRGFIETLDVEVSPNTDEDGNYLVFVEMTRDDNFPNKFLSLIKDVENLSGKTDWRIKTYFSDGREFSLNDPELFNYVIIDPSDYVEKDKFDVDELRESVRKFLSNSLISGLTFEENIVTISGNRRSVIGEVVDVGVYDDVIERNYLTESAFGMKGRSQEEMALKSIVGNYDIITIGRYLSINNGDEIMLLKNTHIL